MILPGCSRRLSLMGQCLSEDLQQSTWLSWGTALLHRKQESPKGHEAGTFLENKTSLTVTAEGAGWLQYEFEVKEAWWKTTLPLVGMLSHVGFEL